MAGSFPGILSQARRAHPVRGKGRSPPVRSSFVGPSFSPSSGHRARRRKEVAMSTSSASAPLALPDRPDLRQLKDQARDLLRSGEAASLSQAQFRIARRYGFPSWPKLKTHVESLSEVGQLKEAIDNEDPERVKALMTRNPALHRAPLGYRK